ncbi:MAG TPA: T9SS type A sorting domain-containing protein [Bacteroidia bacterium]|jgi:hypothetical protein|nr:T9SS type A sorting domain-containing protein [Bacteroidia bacterium]
MKRIPLVCFFVFLTFSIQAQNLVPNYSFENKLQCPTSPDEFAAYVSLWEGGGGGGPSYYTQCVGDSIVNTPSNAYGYQYARTGVSYAGIYTFVKTVINERSYIQDSLTSPLVAGTKYFLTFYVSLADNYKYACNNIEAYFSDSALVYNNWDVKSYLIPQVTNDTLYNPLKDTTDWIKVAGSFVAKGGEKYIIIGNFKDDAHSDTIPVKSNRGDTLMNWANAYYFIDDVIVSTDSNYADSISAIGEFKVESEKLKVFPNPSNGVFTVESSVVSHQLSVEVYNELGQKIFSQFSTFNSQFSINLSNQPSGIYLYRITTEQGELIGSGKLIIE